MIQTYNESSTGSNSSDGTRPLLPRQGGLSQSSRCYDNDHHSIVRDEHQENTMTNKASTTKKNRTNMKHIPVVSFHDTSLLLQQSNNVLLLYRLNDLRRVATLNLCLALLCLVYCGVNIGLILVNYLNSRAELLGDEEVVSEDTYHRVEFWATFWFAVVECASLVVGGSRSSDSLTQQAQGHQSTKSLLGSSTSSTDGCFLKIVLFFNIVATWVPAMLVTLNREIFEIFSHEIEYLNELTMTIVDLILLKRILKLNTGRVVLTCVAGIVAFLQLGVYNLLGRREDGDMVGEVPAHYFEFAFEIVSSMIAFMFCMDNRSVAENEIIAILYGSLEGTDDTKSPNDSSLRGHMDCELCKEDKDDDSATTVCYTNGASALVNSSQSAETSYGSMSNV